MAKAIGPSFPSELQIAGVLGLPFAWGVDGSFTFDVKMTPTQITAVLTVYAAHDPLRPAPPTPAQLNLADLRTKIDALIAAGLIPQAVKDFAAALKAVLT